MEKQRIVVKVGTSTLTHNDGGMDFRTFERLARVLSDISNMGHEVVLVTSGAIAVGKNKLRLSERPKELRMKQAAAAVGQCELMHIYDKFFGEYGKVVGQILLTGDDVERPKRKENLINTFRALLDTGVIPIVNANDSVNYQEIQSEHMVFGDNDTLSAVVTVLCDADLLVLLSDIDGLYESDPHQNPDAPLIPRVEELDEKILALAGGSISNRGTGGMVTKLTAAKTVMEAGANMIITNGERPEDLYDIIEGKSVGTLFVGKK